MRSAAKMAPARARSFRSWAAFSVLTRAASRSATSRFDSGIPLPRWRQESASSTQELNLVETFTVAENLALGHEPRVGPWIDRRAIQRRAVRLLEDLQFDLDTRALVSGLTIGQRQQVEIAKALGGRFASWYWMNQPRPCREPKPTTSSGSSNLSAPADWPSSMSLIISRRCSRSPTGSPCSATAGGVGTWQTADLTLPELVAAMVGEAVDVRTQTRPQRLHGSPAARRGRSRANPQGGRSRGSPRRGRRPHRAGWRGSRGAVCVALRCHAACIRPDRMEEPAFPAAPSRGRPPHGHRLRAARPPRSRPHPASRDHREPDTRQLA